MLLNLLNLQERSPNVHPPRAEAYIILKSLKKQSGFCAEWNKRGKA